MRRTLQVKWHEAIAILDNKAEEYLNNFFTGIEKPTCYYIANPLEIEKVDIDYISVYLKGKPSYYNKVTKVDLNELLEYIDTFDDREYSVHCHYTKVDGKYKATGADDYSKILSEQRMSFDKTDLIDCQRELNKKYAPKDGYIPCSYCSKQIPIDEAVDYTIMFQNSRQDPRSRSGYKRFLDRKTNKYCSNNCGVNDQMAHEG